MTGRRRNAAETTARLLAAADELFAERGFERTTIREVGQRAGVDPALIARYFGGKAELYLAALRRDLPAADEPLDLRDRAMIERVLTRSGDRVPSPTLHAAITPHADEELQQAAMAVLERRLIEPSTAAAPTKGSSARVRAELAVAALAGVVTSRRAGSFAELSASDPGELAELLGTMIDAVLEPT